MLEEAGLRPSAAGDVAVPYAPPDRQALERGMFAAGNLRHVPEHLGWELPRSGAPTGPTLFRSTFRRVVAERD